MSWSRGSRGHIVIGSQCNVNAIQPSCLHSQVDVFFSKENPPLQVDFAPGPSSADLSDRLTRYRSQLMLPSVNALCPDWLMIRSAWSDLGDRMLMPSVNAALQTALRWPFPGPLRASLRAPSGLPAQGPWEFAHWQNVGPLALALHRQPSLSPKEALTRPTQLIYNRGAQPWSWRSTFLQSSGWAPLIYNNTSVSLSILSSYYNLSIWGKTVIIHLKWMQSPHN